MKPWRAWQDRRKTDSTTRSTQRDLDQRLVRQQQSGRIPSAAQLRYLQKVLSRRDAIVLRIAALVVVFSALFLGVRFIQRHVEFVPKVGGTYTEALVGSPSRVNPIYAVANDVDRDLSRLIYSGLFRQQGTDGLIPDLATGFQLSEDEKTYTITIRQDAYWHDGQPVSMDDVLFTIESIQNAEYQSPLSVNLSGVQVQRVDDTSFTLTLPEPFAPFINTLTFGILPVHLWGDVPPLNVGLVEYNLKPVGSGPYVFEKLTRDRLGNIKSYTLQRNENYYGPQSYVQTLEYKFYPDFQSAISAVENKKVDGISFVPEELQKDVENERGLNFVQLNLPQYTAIFFNQKTNTRFQDKKVRQALALATDKQGLIDSVLQGEGESVDGPILPGMLGFNPEMTTYNYDLDRANGLLEEAGWKYPEDAEVRQKNGSDLAFTLTTSDRELYVQAAQLLAEQWAKIGVRVEINILDANRIQSESIKPRSYEALLFGEIIGFDPDPYPFWHSSQQRDPGLALAIFFQKDSDKALERARQVTSEEERKLKYVEFQNILADEVPAIFLYQPIYTYGLSAKVKGYSTTFIEVPSDRFAHIENWYISTSLRWH
ncbi:MAG: hypothetical protein H6760_00140 [Candidatus Nomurabacteria bacterium]|nr:MAG: hypothetical protein H6760_00140 [Candidatus Nomurabacteria bacterium]